MLPNVLSYGGAMMWVLLLASVAAVAVFIERALHLHRAQINSTEFLNGVRTVLKRDNIVEAVSICDATPGRFRIWSRPPSSIAIKAASGCGKRWRKRAWPKCRAWNGD